MGQACRLLRLVAVATLVAGHATAQTLPKPGDPGPSGAMPSPGDPQSGAPMSAPRGGPMGGGGLPDCKAEFDNLRTEVAKRGKLAKEAGQARAPREEICKYVTTLADAEAKWGTFVEGNVSGCGIPVEIVNQLRQMHSNTEQARQRVCSAGGPSGLHLDRVRLDVAHVHGMEVGYPHFDKAGTGAGP